MRFFEADPRRLASETACPEPGDRWFEQARRGRKEDRKALFGRTDLGGERCEAVRVGRIERLEAQPVEERRQAALSIGRQVFFQSLARHVTERLVVEVRPRGADDLEPRIDQRIGAERAQRRQQHPLRQIARRPEQQQAIGDEAGHILPLGR